MSDLPELKTGNVDISNTLLKIAEMNRTRDQQAAENETRGLQNQVLQGTIARQPIELKSQNALYEKQKAENIDNLQKTYNDSAASIMNITPEHQYGAYVDFYNRSVDAGSPIEPPQTFKNDDGSFNITLFIRKVEERNAKLKELRGKDAKDYEVKQAYSLTDPKSSIFVSIDKTAGSEPPKGYTFTASKDNSDLNERIRHNRVMEGKKSGSGDETAKVGTINQVSKQLASVYLPLAKNNMPKTGLSTEAQAQWDALTNTDPITGGVNEARLRDKLLPHQQKAYDWINIRAQRYAATMPPADAVNKAMNDYSASFPDKKPAAAAKAPGASTKTRKPLGSFKGK